MTETPSVSPNRTRTTAALSLIAVFIGGLLVGIAGDRFYIFHRRRATSAQSLTQRIVEHLDRELNLTPQQKTDVQRIIDQHHVRIDAVMTGVQPQIRRELDAANAEIEKLLTPEQQEQFKKMRMRVPGTRRHGFPPPPF